MKKIMLLGALLVTLLAFGSTAFAAALDNETLGAGKSIRINDGALNLNFSPGVFGQYTTEGTTATEQWYAIGTYHGGGDFFWATSQQQTAVWKKERADSTQKFTDAAIPDTVADSNSETQWTGADWKR